METREDAKDTLVIHNPQIHSFHCWVDLGGGSATVNTPGVPTATETPPPSVFNPHFGEGDYIGVQLFNPLGGSHIPAWLAIGVSYSYLKFDSDEAPAPHQQILQQLDPYGGANNAIIREMLVSTEEFEEAVAKLRAAV